MRKSYLYFILFFAFAIFIMFQIAPPSEPAGGGPIGASPGTPIRQAFPERFTKGIDEKTFVAGDTTPDVTNGSNKIYHRWGVSATTAYTITEFDDANSGVTDFKDGDWFALDLDNDNVTIDFTSAYIEGNKGVALVGDSSYPVTLLFEYISGATKFRCLNFNYGVSGVSRTVESGGLALTGDTSVTEAQLLTNEFITNQGASGEIDVTLPAVNYRITRKVIVEESYVIELNPPSGEKFDLDGTDLDADDCVDSGATVFDKMAITRMKDAGNNWRWSLDTIRGVWTDTGASD